MKRVTIVTGHAGSGKSEFSVNLALSGYPRFEKVALADVDVVNPYFRSREQRALLESRGVRVAANQLGLDSGVDLPAVSPEVFGLIRDTETCTILDAGGDPVGARLLGSVRHLLDPFATEVLCVVNGSRPETATAERAIAMIRSIEDASGLSVTGLVNNTHMLEETGIEEVFRGDHLCRAITENTGIPIRYAGVPASLEINNDEERIGTILGDHVPIAMYLRETWMGRQDGTSTGIGHV